MDAIKHSIQSTDLYAILQIEKTASIPEIKKAYRKLALCYHPDRLSSQTQLEESHIETAKLKFQQISASYAILSDEKARRRYDTTGRFDSIPGLAGAEDNVYEYFSDLYDSCVTPEAIEEFKRGYQGSRDEQTDIYEAYAKHHGDMGLILSEIPCSSVDDEDRFRTIIDAGIAKSELPSYRKYTNETPKDRIKRKREAEREAAQAEILAQELGLSGTKSNKKSKTDAEDEENRSLQLLIASKQSQRASQFDEMLTRLESKASKPKKQPGTSKAGQQAQKAALEEDEILSQSDYSCVEDSDECSWDSEDPGLEDEEDDDEQDDYITDLPEELPGDLASVIDDGEESDSGSEP